MTSRLENGMKIGWKWDEHGMMDMMDDEWVNQWKSWWCFQPQFAPCKSWGSHLSQPKAKALAKLVVQNREASKGLWFPAWLWKCLESGRNVGAVGTSTWTSMVKTWNMMSLAWRILGFQTFFDQTHEAADSVLDRLPAHRRNLFEEEHRKLSKDSSSAFQIVPTTHPSSIQLRQVSYHSYTWDLFVIMSDIDWLRLIARGHLLCDSTIRIFRWCSDHQPVLGEFVVFWRGSLRPHRKNTL